MSRARGSLERFIREMPKAELHVHIEGTLEPELLFRLARKNRIPLRFATMEALRAAYRFEGLQAFLEIYYEGTRVLVQEEDFFELTRSYLERAARENIRHAEIFFDPQAHTRRGVPFRVVLDGIQRALEEARQRLGLSSRLILCFLRDLGAEDAMRTLEEALPFKDRIAAVGLDSAEIGHPPAQFEQVFRRARAEGFLTVAHAGEEGPASYIWEALDLLGVARIDHGVRCVEDPALVDRLVAERIPLTVCPLSNVKLKVFDDLARHNLKQLLDLGVRVTVNSDDPAYFGGYLGENLIAVHEALGLTALELYTLARNAFEASFLDGEGKRRLIGELDRFVEGKGFS